MPFKERSIPELGITQTPEQSRLTVDVVREIRRTGTSVMYGDVIAEINDLSAQYLLDGLPNERRERLRELEVYLKNIFGDQGTNTVSRAYVFHPERRRITLETLQQIEEHRNASPQVCKLRFDLP